MEQKKLLYYVYTRPNILGTLYTYIHLCNKVLHAWCWGGGENQVLQENWNNLLVDVLKRNCAVLNVKANYYAQILKYRTYCNNLKDYF